MLTVPRKFWFLVLLAVPAAIIWDWAYRTDELGVEMTDERIASLLRAEREQNYRLYGIEVKPYEEQHPA